MTDTAMDEPRPDLSDRARALSPHLGRTVGEYEAYGVGYDLFSEWIHAEILCDDIDRIGPSGVDRVAWMLGEDFPLAANVRELWAAARALSWLFGKTPESSAGFNLGTWIINWSRTDDGKLDKKMVLIDSDRPIPRSMRHWFEKAGIYQPKDFGLHREWRQSRHIYGSSRKARFTRGTLDGRRHFRVIPDLDRMDICDGNFDRWANSRAASVTMPKTHSEFETALDRLLELSAPHVYRNGGPQ